MDQSTVDPAKAGRGRSTGVLLHPTALPGSPVCGSFGEPCRRWLQLLADHGIGVWQMLPLAPPDPTGSPYSSPSCNALNPWFLDGQDLANEGFIGEEALRAAPGADAPLEGAERVEFNLAQQRASALGDALLDAWPEQDPVRHAAFNSWAQQQRSWLQDHARFQVLHDQHNTAWWEWPLPLARHDNKALRSWAEQHDDALLREQLIQWQLDRQWQAIRRQATNLGIQLFGDLPFYVSSDSADVWSKRSLFTVKENGQLSPPRAACRPITSRKPDSCGAHRCTAGDSIGSHGSDGGGEELRGKESLWICCAWITSVPLRPSGPSPVPTAPRRTVNGSPPQAMPCCASCAEMLVVLFL